MRRFNDNIPSLAGKDIRLIDYIDGFERCYDGAFFVYALLCPITNVIKYIGSTNDIAGRFLKHIKSPSNKLMKEWEDALFKQGLFPKMKILSKHPDLESGRIAEILETHRLLESGVTLLNVRIAPLYKIDLIKTGEWSISYQRKVEELKKSQDR